ncbi:hypothetical protein [Paracoccus marcusii]|uniref:hypothetical protein n=1 Tax=Paracoccus marcusii TaxID=59779 RepID=UPI003263E1B7
MGEPRGEPEPRHLPSFLAIKIRHLRGKFQYEKRIRKMFYIDKVTGKKIWKYHLVDEVLAAASAGMRATTGLDQRCIIFTIHLNSVEDHPQICQTLFQTAESYFSKIGLRRTSATYTGLASFIDVNGSKFSGADRDHSQMHCHGILLIPWNIRIEQVQQLIVRLESASSQANKGGQFITRNSLGAIEIKLLNVHLNNNNLPRWVEYAQKETVRITTEGDLMILLPFDTRVSYGEKVAAQIERKRDKTLISLQGPERFKILRC